MALSAHKIGRANDRRETRHWRIARGAISKRVALQADFSRSVGHQAQNVSAARGAAECRRPNIQSTKFPERKNSFPPLLHSDTEFSGHWLNASINPKTKMRKYIAEFI